MNIPLYHFCPAEALTGIADRGIVTGPAGYVWLTALPRFFQQTWAKDLEIADRIERRLQVEIPEDHFEFLKWLTDCDASDKYLRPMADLWGAGNWLVFRARVKPEWIVAIDEKPPNEAPELPPDKSSLISNN